MYALCQPGAKYSLAYVIYKWFPVQSASLTLPVLQLSTGFPLTNPHYSLATLSWQHWTLPWHTPIYANTTDGDYPKHFLLSKKRES